MKTKTEKSKQQTRLEEVIKLVLSVCKAKGWTARISDQDKEKFLCATVQVSKSFSKGYISEDVLAALEIYISKNKIEVTPNNTSFYGYGLKSLLSVINAEIYDLPWVFQAKNKVEEVSENQTEKILTELLNRFDRVVRQLKRRYNARPTITVQDEYDVQDVLQVLLTGYFDDIRPEEYAPSNAGSASRLDFLLKKEQTIIEVKFATKKLTDKKIGEQLIIDIKRYENHPDCKNLFCFVYDPEGNIVNPTALENDLSGVQGAKSLKVKVLVSPK